MAHSGGISTTTCFHPTDGVTYDPTSGKEICSVCQRDPSRSCIHPKDQIIYDYSHGDEVCTLCALVLSEKLTLTDENVQEVNDVEFKRLTAGERMDMLLDTRCASDNVQSSQVESSTSVKFCCPVDKDTISQKVRAEIANVCSRLFMDTESLISSACDIYFSCKPSHRYKNVVDMKNVAYSVYLACIRQQTPRPPKLIASYCGVKPKSILNMQKKHGDWEDDLSACDYVDRIGHFLEIPFYIRRMTGELLIKKEEMLLGRRPESVAVAALYSVMKKLQRSYEMGLPTVNLRRWSQQLNIPFRTLRTIVSKIPKFSIKACGGVDTCFYYLSIPK